MGVDGIMSDPPAPPPPSMGLMDMCCGDRDAPKLDAPPSMEKLDVPAAPPPTSGFAGSSSSSGSSRKAPYSFLDGANEFIIAQTRKGCVQEMLGCEAESEFKFTMNGEHVAMLNEKSDACIRCLCPVVRPWDTLMTLNSDPSNVLLTFQHPCTFSLGPCKCCGECCFQDVTVVDNQQQKLGMIQEQLWFCVPLFHVKDAQNAVQYEIHEPTCCGGACVNLCAQGCCNCRVPYLVYAPGHEADGPALKATGCTPVPGYENEVPDAQITKVWAGMVNELFTDADTFELKCPEGSDAQTKARLIGATLLINQTVFEAEKNNGDNGGGGAY